MAEIKIGAGLSGEIAALRSAGSGLNGSAQDTQLPPGAEMQTCQLYAAQQKAIRELVGLYRQLVMKDADDLSRLVQGMENLDSQIAANT